MAYSITLGEVAQRTEVLDIRCGRCERHGRLNVARLLAEHGPHAPIAAVMRTQVVDCPKRDDAQIQNRCDPYCLDLVPLFQKPEPSWRASHPTASRCTIFGQLERVVTIW
jgi:hypothetical protein